MPRTKNSYPKKKPQAPEVENVPEIPSLEEIGNAFANTSTDSLTSKELTPLKLPSQTTQPIRIGFWGDSHAAANFFY
jgi:hypothetical protein